MFLQVTAHFRIRSSNTSFNSDINKPLTIRAVTEGTLIHLSTSLPFSHQLGHFWRIITPSSIGECSVVVGLWVCICLCVTVCARTYLRNHSSKLQCLYGSVTIYYLLLVLWMMSCFSMMSMYGTGNASRAQLIVTHQGQHWTESGVWYLPLPCWQLFRSHRNWQNTQCKQDEWLT